MLRIRDNSNAPGIYFDSEARIIFQEGEIHLSIVKVNLHQNMLLIGKRNYFNILTAHYVIKYIKEITKPSKDSSLLIFDPIAIESKIT